MNLQYGQTNRFFLSVQTKYEYEGLDPFERKPPCTCKTTRFIQAETRGRCEKTTDLFIVCRYIWKGLESTEHLLHWSGSQRKRTLECDRESAIPYLHLDIPAWMNQALAEATEV